MSKRLTDQQVQEAIRLFESPGQIALTHFEGRFVLLGRAYDAEAAAEINRVKSRSAGRPLVMCFPNLNLARRANLSSPLLSLLPYFQDRVTISIPAPPEVSVAAHRGVGMIGVRWITSDPLSQLMLAIDEPLLISSANPTGRPSARHLEVRRLEVLLFEGLLLKIHTRCVNSRFAISGHGAVNHGGAV